MKERIRFIIIGLLVIAMLTAAVYLLLAPPSTAVVTGMLSMWMRAIGVQVWYLERMEITSSTNVVG